MRTRLVIVRSCGRPHKWPSSDLSSMDTDSPCNPDQSTTRHSGKHFVSTRMLYRLYMSPGERWKRKSHVARSVVCDSSLSSSLLILACVLMFYEREMPHSIPYIDFDFDSL